MEGSTGDFTGDLGNDLKLTNSNPVTFGSNFNNPGFLEGKLKEIRFWNTARSQEEIQANRFFAIESPGQQQNLVGYYYPLSNSANNLKDFSSLGNDGTLGDNGGNINIPGFQTFQVSPAGDINGDDFDDFVIGDPYVSVSSQNGGGNKSGEVFVVFGNSQIADGGNVNLNNLSLTGSNIKGFKIAGLEYSFSGTAVRGAGDINGDGFDDLIITAPDADDSPTFVLYRGDFTASVNELGTLGNDVMEGTPSGDNLIGSGGRDNLFGNGGADYIQAGLDEDIITVADTNFRLVDGGPGVDRFQLAGYVDQSYDLSEFIASGRIRNIEAIDLSNYGSNTLTLPDVPLLYRLSDTSNTLFITGDRDDTVAFTNMGTEDVAFIAGDPYKRFTLDNMTVLVEEDVQTTQADPASLPAATGAPEPSTAETLNPASTSSISSDATTTSGGKAQLVVSSPIASSDDEAVEFVIERTGNISERVVAEYYTTDVEVQTRGGDHYRPVAGILVFKPGEIRKTVSVPLVDNDQP